MSQALHFDRVMHPAANKYTHVQKHRATQAQRHVYSDIRKETCTPELVVSSDDILIHT